MSSFMFLYLLSFSSSHIFSFPIILFSPKYIHTTTGGEGRDGMRPTQAAINSNAGRDRGAGRRAEEVKVRTRGQRRRAGGGAQSGGEQGT